jgi:3-dehydroquinate synthetase
MAQGTTTLAQVLASAGISANINFVSKKNLIVIKNMDFA